ncbi:helix-turn-helix domain-containing protein [Streptomyces longispororuber]|uniref:helix-turn-helix domain-containing protein n=1 Tax=Streptomyces longispororuber TaxID=68230 RepID=UPI00210ED424|nr:helix-turn-helix domain-containing protein [Streptomyces longispororuber]MCQ4209704.1 helix-turn-helix domain-containing protein [Streptomyces longispororuber]
MSNRTKKKGRRHRTVNRTPRPVTTTAATAERTTAPVPQQQSGPDVDRVLRRLGYGRLRVPAPAAPAPYPGERPAPAAPATPAAQAPVALGDLGKNTRLTWQRLEQAPGGMTLEQMCEAVGWTPRTVSRHLKALADGGLAEQTEDGRWSAAAAAPAAAR